MLEKIRKQIEMYEGFYSNKSFAVQKIKDIISWLWLSKDMEILTNAEFSIMYDRAIDAIVEIETV